MVQLLELLPGRSRGMGLILTAAAVYAEFACSPRVLRPKDKLVDRLIYCDQLTRECWRVGEPGGEAEARCRPNLSSLKG